MSGAPAARRVRGGVLIRGRFLTAVSRVAAVAAALLLAGSTGAPIAAQTSRPPAAPSPAIRLLQRDISAILNAPLLRAGTWGVSVRSLPRHDTLFERNAGKLLTPSSNMKIVTLATAADRLGWDYTFQTQLATAAPIDAGVLRGDLVAIGSGDPSIDDWDGQATRLFTGWAEQLKAAGVRSIAGRIIGDDDAFEDEWLGSGWAWDDLDRSFATSIGALQFNENTAQIVVTPGSAVGAPATIAGRPESAALVIRNMVATAARNAPAALTTRRAPGATTLEIRGAVPLGAGAIVRNVSVMNPTVYFATQLRSVLVAAGISVSGAAVDIDDISDAPSRASERVLVEHRSAPLSELAQPMMRLSQNLYAETVLKALGAWAGTPSTAGGIAAARQVLDLWDVPASELRQSDGSGLSPYNLASASALVSILEHVNQDAKLRGAFLDALPVAGRDGTLENRMKRTPAQGNVRAKTGSLSNARSLSGYVTAADGEPLVFSIIGNNFGVPPENIDRAIDAVVVRLARFSRR